jgi:HSP20 family protein
MSLLATPTDVQALVDRMFDELPTLLPEWTTQRLNTINGAPAMDLYEKDGKYVIELAVPGFEAREINAEVNAGTITITGTHVDTTEKQNAKFYRKEMRRGSFTRTITLPQDVDPDKVDARVERGVLKLMLSPLKAISAKRIAIKGET